MNQNTKRTFSNERKCKKIEKNFSVASKKDVERLAKKGLKEFAHIISELAKR